MLKRFIESKTCHTDYMGAMMVMSGCSIKGNMLSPMRWFNEEVMATQHIGLVNFRQREMDKGQMKRGLTAF